MGVGYDLQKFEMHPVRMSLAILLRFWYLVQTKPFAMTKDKN
jgi:hypothetical protein